MRLEHLQYVVEIANTNSLSAAAKRLFVSQPALTAAINSLELELGVKLFDRSNAGAYMTRYGEAFIQVAERVLAELADVSAALREDEGEAIAGLISDPIISPGMMAAIIQRFMLYCPKDTINNVECISKRMTGCLEQHQGAIGLALIFDDNIPEFRKQVQAKDIYCEPIHKDHIIALVGASHRLAQTGELHKEDLKKEVLIAFNEISGDVLETSQLPSGLVNVNDMTRLNRQDCKSVAGLGNLEVIKKFLAQNPTGVVLLPESSIYDDPYLQMGLIVPLRLIPETKITHYILYANSVPLRRMDHELIRAIKQVYAETEKMNCRLADKA